jgi:outer membrane protein assembly factor BamD
MKTKKIIFVLFCTLVISSCAVKDYSPKNFEKYTAKQILDGGKKALAKKDYNEAAKYFEAIDALYPYSPEARQGQLDIIYAYYKAEDYASTLAAASRYIHLYPEGSYTDYAYYMKGVANFDKNKTIFQKIYPVRRPENIDISNLQAAFVDFSELVKEFPSSRYAKDAEKRMIYIRNMLAGHELYIAEFYFKRKAYIAAINRASDVVKHYERVPQTKDALRIMIKSYRALGLNKQANDALRIFKMNFPNDRV